MKTSKKSIHIKTGLINQLVKLINLNSYSKIAILTDNNLEKTWLKSITKQLPQAVEIIIPSGEKHKNITTLTSIWSKLNQNNLDRHSLLINLGGGVICDLGGFAASSYMRGIDFIHLPTTLLAQVDASLGGKTGINLNEVKNLIGTFSKPKTIIIDPQILSTLPNNQLISGFAEIIKHGLIKDKKHFLKSTSKKPIKFSKTELTQIIKRSCLIKMEIVKADPQESNSRKILNFGHTIGHAFESLSLKTKSPLLHSQAVSLGMVAEAKLSLLKGLITQQELEIIKSGLKKAHLPTKTNQFPTKDIYKLIHQDKKNQSKTINWTMLKSIGQAVYNQIATKQQIIQSIQYVL